ncbi:hypothetical protein HID58_042838 [Brassica napus]|uniref:Uncharacterized protein n=1 Tax=Brassica napus TaxID=3708 RepID=A0ABQ8BES5_BRANA|nr:hypothetical protein HID58_042838 [Brassica napus]
MMRGGELMARPLCNVHLNNLKHLLKAGSVYGMSGFEVTRSNLNFKLYDSPLSVIRLSCCFLLQNNGKLW